MVVNNDEDFEERYPPPLVLGMFIITTESVESISFLSTEEKSEEKLHWHDLKTTSLFESSSRVSTTNARSLNMRILIVHL